MNINSNLFYCPACKSDKIQSLESIPTSEIAKFWSVTSLESGEQLTKYLDSGKAPSTIHMAKCCDCGLEFASPMFAAGEEWYTEEIYTIRWEFKKSLEDLKPGSEILEIGCGEGVFLELAAREGHSVLGMDFNPRAIQIAKAKGWEVYCCNLRKLKERLPNRKFDAVMFFHVIEHIEDLEIFFQDLSSIMPTGSSLHFSCPGPNRWTTQFETDRKVGLREVWDYPPYHQTRWNRLAADKILSRFGWKLQKSLEEPFDWRGMSTYLVSKELDFKELELSALSPFKRKMKIATKMLQTFVPSIKCAGMSMYYQAIRQ
jgi:SAM-dependent methyltransferase